MSSTDNPSIRKRIVIHSNYHPENKGGIEVVVSKLLDLARQQFGEVWCICGDTHNNLERRKDGSIVVSRKVIRKFRGAPIISLGNITLLSRAIRSDLLVFQEPFPTLWPAVWLLRHLFRKKIIVIVHADPAAGKLMKFAYGRLRASVFRGATIVCTSPQLMAVVEKICTQSKHVIPLALAESYDQPVDLVDVPSRFVLYLGRLGGYKGIEYLLEAAEFDKSIQYVIAGTGPQANLVTSYIRNRNCTNIHFMNFRFSEGQKSALLAACSFVVFPSISENEAFGLVQLEAMRVGKAIVNTNLGSGVNFVAPNDECAITVPPRDAIALSAAIKRLWLDRDECARLGDAGLSRFKNYFSEDIFLARWRDVFNYSIF